MSMYLYRYIDPSAFIDFLGLDAGQQQVWYFILIVN